MLCLIEQSIIFLNVFVVPAGIPLLALMQNAQTQVLASAGFVTHIHIPTSFPCDVHTQNTTATLRVAQPAH
ncbi:hypothetical protein J2S36_000765 [Arcanobacterium hippocoleae]|uniref:Secreted protein n=1 Tax=Arcanobacterium hippocoleae TaxID=149017 RepID=A0ABU1T1K2_9ACTO|nr:hypothetical protein [Arcanobacterium hippocoleae]